MQQIKWAFRPCASLLFQEAERDAANTGPVDLDTTHRHFVSKYMRLFRLVLPFRRYKPANEVSALLFAFFLLFNPTLSRQPGMLSYGYDEGTVSLIAKPLTKSSASYD